MAQHTNKHENGTRVAASWKPPGQPQLSNRSLCQHDCEALSASCPVLACHPSWSLMPPATRSGIYPCAGELTHGHSLILQDPSLFTPTQPCPPAPTPSASNRLAAPQMTPPFLPHLKLLPGTSWPGHLSNLLLTPPKSLPFMETLAQALSSYNQLQA